MENASKALIMAAGILLGVMIMSIGAVLFNSFGGFGKNISEQIEKNQIAEFNTQFTKYYGKSYNTETKEDEYIKLTTHDIVTLANLAQKNNLEYDVQEQNRKSDNSYYIQIKFGKNENLEKYSEKQLLELMQNKDNTNKSYYINNIEFSKITGRVIYVEIKEL